MQTTDFTPVAAFSDGNFDQWLNNPMDFLAFCFTYDGAKYKFLRDGDDNDLILISQRSGRWSNTAWRGASEQDIADNFASNASRDRLCGDNTRFETLDDIRTCLEDSSIHPDILAEYQKALNKQCKTEKG
jgi:hypothetical protein